MTESKIFTATVNGLFVSSDMGTSWSKVEHNLISYPQSLLYYNNRLYLGDNDRIMVTSDEGFNWYTKTPESFSATTILKTDDTYMYANTNGDGIWKIELAEINDKPLINSYGGVTSTDEDSPISITLADFDISDSDNTFPHDFTMTLLESSNYTVSGNSIIPNLNFSGQISVPVILSDGYEDSETFQLNIDIQAVNDVPTITEFVSNYTTNEDEALSLLISDFVVEDPDNTYPDDFVFIISDGDDYSGDGSNVVPSENFNGTLLVTVAISDGTDNSESIEITVTVEPVNDAPVITGLMDNLTTQEAMAVELLISNIQIQDPDNVFPDDFTLTIGNGDNYTVSENQIIPNTDFFGTLSVPISVNDGLDDSDLFLILVEVEKILGLSTPIISIYPNPTREKLTISHDHSIEEIALFSFDGKLIFTEKNINARTKVLDIKSFKSGNYILKINDGNRWINEKIMIK